VSSGRITYTVSQLTGLVRAAVSASPALEDVFVEGEVSNLRMPASGHLYFTLKDAAAGLRCVCFRREAQRIPFHPENGMRIVAHGRVDVYDSEGVYQLYVDALEPAGLGALALAVEQLARRLSAEGLFDPARKRPLPVLPRRVAVISSSSGAAVRDACTVIGRRAPGVGVVVVPTIVQGEGAPAAVVLALDRAQRLSGIDVILLVRGGGSFEDLMAFQDEQVARAIRGCAIPVVTGIGHETDTTIADHAADRRAPTPSAAAEMAVPAAIQLRDEVATRAARLRQALRQEVAVKRRRLDAARERMARVSPDRRVPGMRQQLDGRAQQLRAALLRELGAKRRRLDRAAGRLELASPVRRLPAEREGLRRRAQALEAAGRALVRARRAALDGSRGRLEALSPRRTIERGFSVTLDAASGAVVTDPGQVAPGQRLRSLLAGGEVESEVVEGGSGGEASTP